MTELLALVPDGGFSLILLIGVAIFSGTVGGKLFHKLHIPQIVGYVFVGILIGPVCNIISPQTLTMLEPFNLVALGIIGFLVGGELKRDVFSKFGKQVFYILLFEGITAFLAVGVLSFLIMWCFSDWHTALAVGIVFAAICAATDPASTISVLWEYKARGPLTSMLTAIVMLDDALALMLYAIGISVASVVIGHQETGLSVSLAFAFCEIAGSLIVGSAAGFGLHWISRLIDDQETNLVFIVSTLLLCIGTAIHFHLDVILTSMAIGVVMANLKSRKTKPLFEIMHKFTAAPIYVLFFVLVGARLNFAGVNKMILLLVAAYVVGSIVGKTAGAYFGAAYSGAVRTVRNYLGFCLYPQGGIAIGLLIMASNKFDADISSVMLLVVIIGAFILQVIGPIGVKLGAKKAGELGLNVTEEDLVKTYKVNDVMDTKTPTILSGMSLGEIIKIVSETDSSYYSVVDDKMTLQGAVTLNGIRNTFQTQELNDWLIALDIMEPVAGRITSDIALSEALEKIKRLGVDCLPVIASENRDEFIGILDAGTVHRRLSAEVLAKQKEADKMYSLGIA